MQTGKYELISKLAIGGMAEVFLARAAGPMGFEKTVVLKRILPHLAEEPGFVKMFLREAKLVAQLNHPNIVQIFDFGEDNGSYFLAMEYIDGPNLRALIKKARAVGMPLPPALCARIIASACEGLAFAHDYQDLVTGKPLGLIHRDISTDNILLSRQGAVKVVDFGIAKTSDQSQKTQTGVIKGKVAYMSPEQIRGKPLDRRVDVYALGVVLYELLAGQKPFQSPTDASLMQAILFEPLPPALRHRPDLPLALQRILERALAKDRERRYPDCRAFQADLEDFILSTGKTVGAYQISQFIAQLSPASPSGVSPARDTGERPAISTSISKSSLRTVQARTPKPLLSEAETLPLPAAQRRISKTLPVHNPETAPPAAALRPTPPGSSALKSLPGLVGAALLMLGGGYIAGASTGREAPIPTVSHAPAIAALSLPTPTSQAHAKALSPPKASATLTAQEKPVPSSLVASVDPSEQLAQETEAEQAPRQERSGARRASRGERQAGAARTGTLLLVVRGWADIWVDGQKKGRVPPINELELPAGRHELKLVNPALKPYRAVVTIAPGEKLEHRVSFQPAESSPKTAQGEMVSEIEASGVTSGSR
jgi:serine/threonine-protein kinase